MSDVSLRASRALFAAVALVVASLPGMAQSQSQSGSNASNFTQGAQLSVNPRTGALSLAAELFRIPGIVSGMDASLSLSFHSDQAQSDVENEIGFFGLPYGWSLGISYLYNDGQYIRLSVDGQQTYILDENWQSSFVPAGSTESVPVNTGLQQYNRLDANFKKVDNGETINGATVQYAFATLSGAVQYFSAEGLLLRHADRFGNKIDYLYSQMTESPRNVRLTGIIDSWGNKIEIAACSENCLFPGETEYVVTLPDNRTVHWVQSGPYTISYIADTQKKLTRIDWVASPADHGKFLISQMTTPSGGMTAVEWDRLQVCTKTAETSSCVVDGNVTTWPVVKTLYRCPNTPDGENCGDEATSEVLTTSYTYTSENGVYNYTGFPQYSPYEPADPNADALMASNDTAFTYGTITSMLTAGGQPVNKVENTYNFLHLMTERSVSVLADQSNGVKAFMLSKVTSYCHILSGADNSAACPMNQADYQNLPANYQSPVRVGSCQYNVGPNADTSSARRSLVTMAYNAFGQSVNERKYHGTETTGVGECDSRTVRLDTSGLQLVTDFYKVFDTPDAPGSDGYLSLGPGSGQHGLPTGQQSFIYIDPDENGVAVHGALAETETPIMVKLICNTLESDGSNIKTSTTGLMATSTQPPTTPTAEAELAACKETTPWVDTVAPPKVKSLTYDAKGRGTSSLLNWSSAYTAPSGVAETGTRTSYTLTERKSGEESCTGNQAVLQVEGTKLSQPGTPTNTTGNVAQTHRVCTLNGFHLSSSDPFDPESSTQPPWTYFTHHVDGLTKSVLHPNGTSETSDYYYVCPTFAGQTNLQACPASLRCPYTQGAGKNCLVSTLQAGSGNTSYVDGVTTVTIKDGLGRVVSHLDNTGAASTGEGYTKEQSRGSQVYDSRGLVISSTSQVGTDTPIAYTTTMTHGPKLRPTLTCGPRGTAHELVYDDVAQQFKKVFNGSDRESYTLNDSRKITLLVSCTQTEGSTKAVTTGACPTVAADTSSVTCGDGGYHSYTLHDGSGLAYSVQASEGTESNELSSLQSVTGQSVLTDGDIVVSAFSADMVQYGYSFSSVATDSGSPVSANTSYDRNLLGHKRNQQLAVTANAVETDVVSDLFVYNALADQTQEKNRMSTGDVTLEKHMAYSPPGKMTTYKSYAGVVFNNYYDEMQRLVRHCYPGDSSGSQGENMTLDPITGKTLKIARFTNPNACSQSTSGDVEGISQSYSYNRFGALISMAYSDGVTLNWAYDAYQRPSCFADAMATQAGHSCPASPTAASFSPSASTYLTHHQYYADSDPYRRGMLQRSCRGVPDGSGGAVEKCLEYDYYTPVSTGGICKNGALSTDGSCTDGPANVTGAFAGHLKTESYYTGGSSADGGTLVYSTAHRYDSHGRSASVVTTNAAGDIVLATTYAYDQYNNLTRETSHSTLDTSDTSNFQKTYGYDGLLRLISDHNEDLQGNLIRTTTYEYDASSNLTKKIETTPDNDG